MISAERGEAARHYVIVSSTEFLFGLVVGLLIGYCITTLVFVLARRADEQ